MALWTLGSWAQDPESAGVAAEQAGRIKEAFQLYLTALQALPDPPPLEADLRLRERLIKIGPRLDPPPAIPEDAKRFATRGQVMFGDAQDKTGFEKAAGELRKAVRLAPWFPPIAFNLALVQEKLGQFDAALANMRLYVLASPPDAEQAQTKIYELEYRLEQRGKKMAAYLEGRYLLASEEWTDAVGLFEEACRKGLARGCSNLGIMYQEGWGLAADYAKAVALFERGCDGGDGKGCYFLGADHESKKDAPRAMALLGQACEGGIALACFSLATKYDRGRGVEKDKAQAQALYEKACRADFDPDPWPATRGTYDEGCAKAGKRRK